MKFNVLSANEAVSLVSYNFIDVASVYPITPSTEMSERIYKMSHDGKLNLFGQKVIIQEMQSEGGSIGVMHGALTSGAFCSTFTCSQGLLLMIPEMYRIRGAFLPGVIHVSSRSVATHALSIFCDHSDIYACRQTGWAMLCSSSVQESHDFAAIAHLSSIESHYPFLHFFDGFRTSHEIQKIRIIDESYLRKSLNYDEVLNFRKNSLNNYNSFIRGSNQNDDIYFQCCEAGNIIQNNVITHIVKYMDDFNENFATDYRPFNFYGDMNAEYVIVSMGSVCGTVEEVVDILNSMGKKVGAIKVHLFRPFSFEYFMKVLPKTVKKITVFDRSKEPGSSGEPLFLDIVSCVFEHKSDIEVLSGRFGLGGKNTSLSDIFAVFENMFSDSSKKKFTIGIHDDVSSLSIVSDNQVGEDSLVSAKFFGKGSDGMVGAAKNITKIIGNTSDFFVQYYPQYDSKKSGGLTISHVRLDKKPIKSEYYIDRANYVVCSNFDYVFKYDFTKSLKKGSVFLLNCPGEDMYLPSKLKKYIDQNNVKVFVINALKISSELNLGNYTGIIMQGAFFKICSEISCIDKCTIRNLVRDFYSNKNKDLIDANLSAIDLSFRYVKECAEINSIPDNEQKHSMNDLISLNRGNELPVSRFMDYYNGNVFCGSSKNNVTDSIKYPKWIPENCSQCGMCSFICPHSSIRAFLLTNFESSNMDVPYIKAFGKDNLNFNVSVSKNHCTGCSLCEKVCPGKMGKKALIMENRERGENCRFELLESLPGKQIKKVNTVHNLQFIEPLMKYSSACPGCGEAGYARLISQLYGERLVISNATGCSSIWGGNASSNPYCKSNRGLSPAWQNSLFENAAEFGLGMYFAHKSMRNKVLRLVSDLILKSNDEKLKKICNEYIQTFNDGEKNLEVSLSLINELSNNSEDTREIDDLLKIKEYISKKSFWIFGGDGWAYDIGFAGLDHVLSTGENINVIVFDTEIYSNTGGQASKATPKYASASFALDGKKCNKKQIAKMMMTYENVYVAHISMGANIAQCLKAISEAEKYNGPSLIIAYSPCIGHRIKGGLSNSIELQKLAVESGAFPLFRYDPLTKKINADSQSNSELLKIFMSKQGRFKYK